MSLRSYVVAIEGKKLWAKLKLHSK